MAEAATKSPPPEVATDARGFPLLRENFDDDPRISFSRLSNTYILEADDGTEYEFDGSLRRWVAVLDESLVEQQSKAYAVAGVDESAPVNQRNNKKRKEKDYTGSNNSSEKQEPEHKRPKKNGKDNADQNKPRNKAIYITNLPDDVTVDELQHVFGKCGVIAEEIDGRKPRIKIYTDENGKPKGDALIVYFRAESVNLAIQMLDDSEFRLGVSNAGGRMRVQAADYSYKAQQDVSQDKKSNKDKKKIIAKAQKLNNKLADWDDNDPGLAPQTSRWDKVVVLKHMFTLKELEEDAVAILDIKEDIREECEKLGEVTNVTLFDKEEDGVVSVKFTTVEAAAACVRMMNGRHFGGEKVEAYIHDGHERFKKSSKAKADDDDQEENERLDKFGKWLEAEGAA